MLMASASVNAQLYKGFGIKAGTTLANETFSINGEALEQSKYKFGFTAGIFKEFHVIQNLKAQIGINYSRKGRLDEMAITNELGELTGNYGYAHYNLDFITTEIYGKYNFLKSKISPYVLAGLRLDFFLSQHCFYRGPDGIENDFEVGIPVTNNKLFGASLGAGVEYQATKLFSVFLEGTYNPDFTYFTNEIYSSNEQKIRGRSFDIRAGIKF